MAIKRQNIRRSVLAGVFLLSEIGLFQLFFSPLLILVGVSRGILSGGLILYGLLFVNSLFMGRAWCGWACPGCAVNEAAAMIVQKRPRESRWYAVKYAISGFMLISVIYLLIRAGGIHSLQPFFGLGNAALPLDLWLVFVVTAVIMAASLLLGRHAYCHYFCWQAPIMILGAKIKDKLGMQSVHFEINAGACRSCGTCNRYCTMGLNVSEKVKLGILSDTECILCGSCEDHFPNEAIKIVYGRLRKPIRGGLAVFQAQPE